MLIIKGITNSRKDQLSWKRANGNRSKTDNVRIQEFVDKFEDTVNEVILGTEKAPAQFHLNFEKDNTTSNKWKLLPISMTNGTVRQIIEKMNVLIDVCESDDDKVKRWKRSVENYKVGLSVLLKKKKIIQQMN